MNVMAALRGTAAGKRIPATVSSRARTPVLLLGLTAIIVGILGMHIWIGSHAPVHTGVAAEVSAAQGSGHHHSPAAPQAGNHHAPPADTAAMPGPGENGMAMANCASSCAEHDMATCLCLLALFMVGAAGLIRPRTGLLLSAAGLRGPPRVAPARAAQPQPPSLIQLSISRT